MKLNNLVKCGMLMLYIFIMLWFVLETIQNFVSDNIAFASWTSGQIAIVSCDLSFAAFYAISIINKCAAHYLSAMTIGVLLSLTSEMFEILNISLFGSVMCIGMIVGLVQLVSSQKNNK